MKNTIERFITGPIETNTFVISNDKNKCLVIDPSSDCAGHLILDEAAKRGWRIAHLWYTHAHFDHIMGIPEIVREFPGIIVFVHPADRPFLLDSQKNGAIMLGTEFQYQGTVRELTEGEQTIGSFTMNVRHLPGHTPGGCALVFDDVCISGDALFASSIGRTDFGKYSNQTDDLAGRYDRISGARQSHDHRQGTPEQSVYTINFHCAHKRRVVRCKSTIFIMSFAFCG